MSAHTPGPWYCERHGVITADVAGHRRQVASTTGDAVMHGDPSTDVISLQMANARLIAAAPELLAALQEATASLAEVANYLGPFDHQLMFDSLARSADTARAVIKKATGGEL